MILRYTQFDRERTRPHMAKPLKEACRETIGRSACASQTKDVRSFFKTDIEAIKNPPEILFITETSITHYLAANTTNSGI